MLKIKNTGFTLKGTMAGLRRYDEEKERLPRLLREGSP
jgi:hypothetical protein